LSNQKAAFCGCDGANGFQNAIAESVSAVAPRKYLGNENQRVNDASETEPAEHTDDILWVAANGERNANLSQDIGPSRTAVKYYFAYCLMAITYY